MREQKQPKRRERRIPPPTSDGALTVDKTPEGLLLLFEFVCVRVKVNSYGARVCEGNSYCMHLSAS